MPDLIQISPSLEDYLEVILRLTETNEKVRVTDLASEMKVAKSSVNQAVKKLFELQLIQHQKYGPLELTKIGKEKATRITKRHQVLTRFFSEILGVDILAAETDACLIEHHLSTETMEKLIDFLETKLGLEFCNEPNQSIT